MADESLAVQIALSTINRASHHALLSCSRELHEVNLTIARALLLLNSSTSQNFPSNDATRDEITEATRDDIIEAVMPSPTPSFDPEVVDVHQSESLRTYKIALVNSVQHWLQTSIPHAEGRNGRDELALILRKAVISHSPAVLALLRKFVSKRKRVEKFNKF
jgi:hypothetical protein